MIKTVLPKLSLKLATDAELLDELRRRVFNESFFSKRKYTLNDILKAYEKFFND